MSWDKLMDLVMAVIELFTSNKSPKETKPESIEKKTLDDVDIANEIRRELKAHHEANPDRLDVERNDRMQRNKWFRND